VLDYQTQQFKLLPLLASAYALTQAGISMMQQYITYRAQMSEGKLEGLPEVRVCLCV